MNPIDSSSTSQPRLTNRARIVLLVRTALKTGAVRFARQTALYWLASYPGDLELQMLHAQSMIQSGNAGRAIPILEKLSRQDPEYIEIYHALLSAYDSGDTAKREHALHCLAALGDQTPTTAGSQPAWVDGLFESRKAMDAGLVNEAEASLFDVLGASRDEVLSAILHMRITTQRGDTASVETLAELYHKRFPDCLQFRLLLADAKIKNGQEEAVELIHQSAAFDASAQVATRLWGSGFAYRSLWPEDMEILLPLPIPVEVAGVLGLNQLGGGLGAPVAAEFIVEETTPAAPPQKKPLTEKRQIPFSPESGSKNKDEAVIRFEKELEKINQRLKRDGKTSIDGRFPMYVIFSSRKGLVEKYGEQSAQVIDAELKKLVEALNYRTKWKALIYYPDDIESTQPYGLTPIEDVNPWNLKLSLSDLDKALTTKGAMIGAVLIVGGGDVVPFHALPNPTDDSDEQVLSDNPYTTLDSNYFIPEWPVGRLPGGAGSDTGLLLTQIRAIVDAHLPESPLEGKWVDLLAVFRIIRAFLMRYFGNFGYTAAIWRRSSLAVFHPIGEGRLLYLSPNSGNGRFDGHRLSNSPLGYFNLHGVDDGAEWYGQKDPFDGGDGPDFPVALKPSDLVDGTGKPEVVFTEACYGAYIENKAEKESLALKFMGNGTRAFIGSTSIAYGAITPPLIGADLLGSLFWKFLNNGYPAGLALVKAKLELVKEMNRRQGYLDGEDQKTLLSFVMYGDPLAVYSPGTQSHTKNYRTYELFPVRTVSDFHEEREGDYELNQSSISQAKEAVSKYLPGLRNAEITVERQRMDEQANLMPINGKSAGSQHANRVVVTFKKQMKVLDRTHRQFVRVTVDRQGKVIKMALSR